MKHIILAALATLSLNVFAAPVGIASGNTTGTNYPMVEDIKRVCSTSSSPITNVITDGALANIDKIYSDSAAQYGVIQTDALYFMQGQDPKMMKKIMMVFPFFSTDAHLLVKDSSPIRTLADLEGKRVVEGPDGSGTFVTVQVIKQLTGRNWTQVLASQADGFDMVMNGKADAEFIVAGKPIGMLKQKSGYRLIPLNDPAFDKFKFYTKTTLSSGTYPGQTTSVPTFKVDNILATYAFATQYQKEIGDLIGCITKNLGTLQTTGHPKWKDVDPLDIDRIQWQIHPAALKAIKAESKREAK